MRRKLTISVQILTTVLYVAAAAILLETMTGEAEERKVYEWIAGAYVSIGNRQAPTERPPSNIHPPTLREPQPTGGGRRLSVDFDALLEINDETVGWVYIEGTPINYPVVQASNNSYYLKRSFSKEANGLGTIFLDSELDMRESDVVILYGHNMGYGRNEMFSSLSGYDKQEFLKDNSEIVTLTADGHETVWEVFAVLYINVTIAEETALYRKENFIYNELYRKYVQLIKSLQLYETGVTPSPGQRILMLSTCRGDGRSNIRRVVFAASQPDSYPIND